MTSSPIASRKCRNLITNGRWANYGRTSYGGNPVVQQTLPAFYLYFTPVYVVLAFFLVAALFIPLGVISILASDRFYEVRQAYNEIHRYQYIPTNPAVNINQGIRSFTVGNKTYKQGTRTRVMLEVRETLKAPVYLYYTLGNFFQNFRDYHNGASRNLLRGTERRSGRYKECEPFQKPGFLNDALGKEVHVDVDGKIHVMHYGDFIYNPCGMAPWSMFNDTFVLYRVVNPKTGNAPSAADLVMICNSSDFGPRGEPLGQSASPNHCHKKGITWKADEEIRYKPLQPQLKWWSLRYPYPNDNVYLTNGWYVDEPGHSLTDPSDYDLQVWLRGAALPNFRKLLRIIDVDLEKGQYVMEIEEFFDVTTFRGSKGFLLRTTSWVGKDGHALGIAFLVVGALSFVLGASFAIEFFLQRNRDDRPLPEPKARWYIFDPNGVEMRVYYEQLTKRQVPKRQSFQNEIQ
ncbi:hypothetical protein C3747_75g21 [Trypanosoma cruzi]|uniref:LEM3 (Ligand-effect modulator 3) family / CDC50 family n=2 Tax=Trypanosoma cruzi TaxID=5693 RepID=Q4DQA4_TRYCC|nr:hypothetical protein, conserved [Trypanosoma cruzi]EAN94703.1 hypothetical protein, conserved [Trypanosoma cruzi]KAF5219800.1 hypothetical protein ECC02_007228 [Trypanosoma cruzi]PWV09744.1 hypothetical protein C3747_75g21 [Trypanosoma cruzi]|eukprot:XP_816554.1 hypothetical protein [Trypanosoma cruzi strain CL Brener]